MLLLIAGCTAFAWVFTQVIDKARDHRAQELTLHIAAYEAGAPLELELTKQLGSLPAAEAVLVTATTPALWWPALLFALAFCAGWFFRHGQARPTTYASEDAQPESPQVENHAESDTRPGAAASSASLVTKITSTPDLNLDFPWDDSLLDSMASLTPDERIVRLEKQNASKAEIIKALEKLVTENREKWLHQDETEARLNHHINELSEDLRVAVFQLQRLQDDTREPKILHPSDMA